MKIKGFVGLFVSMLLCISLASAVEFNLNENFKQGETIIVKISGNFVTPITRDNVFFYEDHSGIPVRIPVDSGIAEINEDYYIYGVLSGKSPGNYSMSIENVKYMQGSSVSEEDLVRNFIITNETADFSLSPGFAVTSDNFFLEVQNLQDNEITISIKTEKNTTSESAREIVVSSSGLKEDSISLKSGEIKKINFEAGYGQPVLQTVELKTANLIYEVPAYIFSALEETPETSFRLEPSEMIYSIPTNSITKKTVYLYNTGNTEITNVTISLSDSISAFVNLSVSKIEKLDANSNIPIELGFSSPGETEVSGNLKADTGSIIAYTQISLKFLSDYIPPPNETVQTSSSAKTCAELQGKVCDTTKEKCDKETVYAKDNVCCIGNCVQKEGKSPVGTIVGVILFILIAGVLAWFYFKKFKKAKKPIDLLKIGRGKPI